VAFRKIIEDHFAKNLPFLKQGYAIRDLSLEVGIPSYLLSAFINQAYGKNFSEFVNENRISYLIHFTEQNPESLLQYTLEVLGQMGGFTSRAAFIAAVKRQTGKTPSEIFGKK
jgi:AraC-like DNA-binding protein